MYTDYHKNEESRYREQIWASNKEKEEEEEENGQYVILNTFPMVVAILGDGNTGTYNENESQTTFLR